MCFTNWAFGGPAVSHCNTVLHGLVMRIESKDCQRKVKHTRRKKSFLSHPLDSPCSETADFVLPPPATRLLLFPKRPRLSSHCKDCSERSWRPSSCNRDGNECESIAAISWIFLMQQKVSAAVLAAATTTIKTLGKKVGIFLDVIVSRWPLTTAWQTHQQQWRRKQQQTQHDKQHPLQCPLRF